MLLVLYVRVVPRQLVKDAVCGRVSRLLSDDLISTIKVSKNRLSRATHT